MKHLLIYSIITLLCGLITSCSKQQENQEHQYVRAKDNKPAVVEYSISQIDYKKQINIGDTIICWYSDDIYWYDANPIDFIGSDTLLILNFSNSTQFFKIIRTK